MTDVSAHPRSAAKAPSAVAKPAALFAMKSDRTRYVFHHDHLSRLAKLCMLPHVAPLANFDGPKAAGMLAETEILITGWGCPTIDERVLDLAPRLRLIAHAAGSVKRIVSPLVFQRGVRVCHAAAANALPVAEYTLASILFANKRVTQFHHLYTAGQGIDDTMRALANGPIGNYKKRVGIIGASRIGRRVIELLRSFDLNVLVYDPWIDEGDARQLGVTLCDLPAAMGCDVVSIHAPLLDETRGLIDAAALACIPDGATLINTARGAIIDQTELERELAAGRFNAVIDVTNPDVPPSDSPLYRLPNVLITPHIAGAMGVERYRLGALIVGEVDNFVNGRPLDHEVDPEMLDREA